MFAIMRIAISGATAIGISTAAFATSAHQVRSQRAAADEFAQPSKAYGSSDRCSYSNRKAFSRLPSGDAAIRIQDQGYRDGIGLPFDTGECW
jgi:hypothetical protein